MFIGHYALGFAAKRFAPRTSLGTLVAAPTLADLLWPLFLLLGWERATPLPTSNPFLTLQFDEYPISHSLLTLIGWGLLFAALYQMRTKYLRGAIVVAALVVSHWVLDYVTHLPDLPVTPSGPYVGLGLWRSVWGTVIVEGTLFVAGVWLYLAGTRARDRIGRWAFPGFAVLLALSYVGSLFSPPPGNTTALALAAIVFGWLFVGIAAWADRHRDVALPGETSPREALPNTALPI